MVLKTHIRDDWSSEIQLVLRAILFKLALWDHNTTYGAALQGLQYVDNRNKSPIPVPPTKWQKSLYGLLTVLGRYGWDKWETWLVDRENGYEEVGLAPCVRSESSAHAHAQPSPNVRLLSRLTSLASTVHSCAAFVSFLVFLVNGRYRTLVDRILRMRLAPPSSQVSREVSFEYLNRQLVWHAFTEFLLFLLPLVGIGRWRRWLSRAWRKTLIAMRSGDEDDDSAKKQGQFAFLPERTCAVCYQAQNPTSTSEADILSASAAAGGVFGSAQTDITNPYEAVPCGCVYCFVCITEKLEAEEGQGWICLRCGEIVRQCKPWNGDVLEETRRIPGSGRSVGFIVADERDGNASTSEEEADAHADKENSGGGVIRGIENGEALEGSNTWAEIDRDNDLDNGGFA